jgi:hypothetical protein
MMKTKLLKIATFISLLVLLFKMALDAQSCHIVYIIKSLNSKVK